jgi:hypothetical protein
MLEARSLSKYYEHTAAGPRSQFHHPTGEILGDLVPPRKRRMKPMNAES